MSINNRFFLFSVFLLLFGYLVLYVFLQNFGPKMFKHDYPYFSSGVVIFLSYISVVWCAFFVKGRVVRLILYVLLGVALGVVILLVKFVWDYYVIDIVSLSVRPEKIDRNKFILRRMEYIFYYSYMGFPIWVITLFDGFFVEVLLLRKRSDKRLK